VVFFIYPLLKQMDEASACKLKGGSTMKKAVLESVTEMK
jgi:hypothetical protein